MSVEKIVCPKCGYSANLVSVGGKGKISTNPIEMIEKCEEFGSGQGSMDCKHFDAEVLRPRPV